MTRTLVAWADIVHGLMQLDTALLTDAHYRIWPFRLEKAAPAGRHDVRSGRGFLGPFIGIPVHDEVPCSLRQCESQ